MKKILFVLYLLLISCTTEKKESYLDSNLPDEKRVGLLLEKMTLDEKIGQMCQYVGDAIQKNSKNADDLVDYTMAYGERAQLVKQGKIGSFLKVPTFKEANELQKIAEKSRLKIPLLIATDAIHGHGMYSEPATIFPTQIGMAASFDTDVAYKIAQYTALEMRATGYHWTFSPNVEVVRDPRWGRSGECFGEDPLLVSEMGVAMVKGYQGNDFSSPNNVLSCAKHFVAGGVSYNGLNGAPADISERTLQEVFFPPFKAAIDAGAYTIMPAHNEINGVPCHAHPAYLEGLVRDTWAFPGFFISDWTDIGKLYNVHRVVGSVAEASVLAVQSGLDMHMHGPGFFDHIKQAVLDGNIAEERIDEAVSKILLAKFRLGLFENRYVEEAAIEQVILAREHVAYSAEAARKSIVLLKNNKNILPLNKDIGSVLVTGPCADSQAQLGDWARFQPNDNVITVLEGVKNSVNKMEQVNFQSIDSYNRIGEKALVGAERLARKSEVAIVVVGENAVRVDRRKTSGENLDRSTLELPGNQMELLRRIKAAGTPVVTVLINGGAIGSEELVELSDAMVEAWEPGMHGGQAIAEVIFGDYNPAGRLPISIPRSVGHLQTFYNHKASAFHRGRFFNSQQTPLFPFGFGLSYTTFGHSELQLPQTVNPTDYIKASVKVSNTGDKAGDEVVLVFLTDSVSSVTTPVKKLVAFKRIHLGPGESKRVNITIANEHLQLLNGHLQKEVEPGTFEVQIGLGQLKGSFIVKKHKN